MRIIYAALACGLAPTIAIAQTIPAESAKPAAPEETPGPSAPAAAPQPSGPSSARPPAGPLASIGAALADKGIYPRAILVDEFAGNVTGGQGRGARNSFATAFGADLDLGRMVGIEGGEFRATFNKSVGTSLAQSDTLNAVSFQTRYKKFQNLRLAILAYEQDLFGGKVNIAAGRVSALSYFNASPLYCNFQSNAVCFNPSVVAIGDQGLSFFPYGTWGGRVKIAPNKRFYVQFGAFEANVPLQPTNGFDWSTRQATGVQAPIEIGFQSATPAAPHAYHLRIGGYINTSRYNDPYLNAAGRPLIPNGGTPLKHQDLHSWYVMGDVVLARPGPQRTVTLFGGTMQTLEDYVPWKSQTLLGVVYKGPFASRPTDTFGLVASYLRLGDRQVDFLNAARRRAGGTDPAYRSEWIIEANYGFQLYRGVRLNPNVQLVLHPDNNLRPASPKRSGNIVAFGMRLSVELGDLLGFPSRR